MASAQAVKVDMLKQIAIHSSQALSKVTPQLSNINSNSNSSALDELLGATLSCTMLHAVGVDIMSEMENNEAAKKHAQLQLAVAAQSKGANSNLGAYPFMHGGCQHAQLYDCLHEPMLARSSGQYVQPCRHYVAAPAPAMDHKSTQH
jgi:hypothetical protein